MSNIFKVFFISLFIFKNKTSAFSLNQPKFCPTASWNSNAITFADYSIVGFRKFSVFVNTNNTIYLARERDKKILVWHEGSSNPTEITQGRFESPHSLFVTSNGDIFVDDGYKNGRVHRWTTNTKTFDTVMYVQSQCWGLFVDKNNTLYCSMYFDHQIVKRSLNNHEMTSIIAVAAGTGFPGSALNQLNGPAGIFVDMNFDLYVADCENGRVQLFPSGESNGITVAGSQSINPTINLDCPTGVIFDVDKYLFIVDRASHRLIGSSINGFRCLVGCYGDGFQSNRLSEPISFSFDRYGNMLVVDEVNDRIQKFEYLKKSCALSLNQLKFCPTASWNPNAITFANQSTVGFEPYSVFVTTNNTIYVAPNQQNSTILVWHENTTNPTKIIQSHFSTSFLLFVTTTGDIFIHDGDENGRVRRWTTNTKTFDTVMYVPSACFGLFVDTNDTLYCSMYSHHQVVKRSLNNLEIASMIIAAGTGFPGSALNQLNEPAGIFVDMNFDLYVADCGNNRIQLFPLGERDGMTVAGEESSNPTINLYCPSGIVLDGEKYLFIVDHGNHRLIGSSINGFRCILGCYGRGSQSNQFTRPISLSFDTFGNIFVSDAGNSRIQKFEYLKKSCAYTLLHRQNMYFSSLSTNSRIYSRNCDEEYSYYESIQIKVNTTGDYSFVSRSTIDLHGIIYRKTFDPLHPLDNLLDADDDSESDLQFKINIRLHDDMTYVLVLTTNSLKETGPLWIVVFGGNKLVLDCLSTPIKIQFVYSSQLTVDSPTFYRDCQVPQCHYETFEIFVQTKGEYVISSKSKIDQTYGYIYKNHFNSLKLSENLLLQHDGSCNSAQFKLLIHLEIDTRYVLVVTTHRPNTIGNFSIFISGPNNITLNHLNEKDHRCVIGDRCNFYIKSIGLTLDDILRDEVRSNITLNNQSISIKISAALTIILFVGGLVNSILSLITFQNKECLQMGCGMYLLASSVTSFLTISMLTIKFWFVILSQINISTSLSVLRGGCISLEVLLKLFLYLDGWLNTCVAVERAFLVLKGVNFNKKQSKHFARQIILLLPLCITGTLLHELLYRRLFVYETERDKTNESLAKRYVSCVTHYSSVVQNYNTIILFIHLVGPFVANLCSALFIIFGGARQRSVSRTDQSYKEHVQKKFQEHKQLIIGPIIILILSIPRLIISLLPGCVKVSQHLWLYLSGYLISFVPSMLIFMIFVVPSQLYMKSFKQSLNIFRHDNHTRQ